MSYRNGVPAIAPSGSTKSTRSRNKGVNLVIKSGFIPRNYAGGEPYALKGARTVREETLVFRIYFGDGCPHHNSFGFRPERSIHDAMETIFFALHHGTLKHVFYADIGDCFHRINHGYLLSKLGTFKLLENQISAWLKVGILDELVEINQLSCIAPIGGISPLLANIALHGIENHLQKFVEDLLFKSSSTSNYSYSTLNPNGPNGVVASQVKSFVLPQRDCEAKTLWKEAEKVETEGVKKQDIKVDALSQHLNSKKIKDSHEITRDNVVLSTRGRNQRVYPEGVRQSQQKVETMENSLTMVRFLGNFVLFHAQRPILELCVAEVRQWLMHVGLEVSEKKCFIRDCRQSFILFGFNIIQIRKNQSDYRVKITPSRQACLAHLYEVRHIIQHNRQVSTYNLISKLRPVVIGWASYYQFCECSVVFRKMGNLVFQMLRHWVFRRHPRENRFSVKEKYWPSGRTYQFDGINHKNNWVLCGRSYTKGGILIENYLPYMSWVHRRKFVKIQGNKSPYDSNHAYWAERISNNSKYFAFSNLKSLYDVLPERMSYPFGVQKSKINSPYNELTPYV